MSEVQPIGGNPQRGNDVRTAIARAAQKSGIDFDYLLAQARIESSLDPSARAATSSAAGLYQFTNATWLNTLEAHGADHGFGWASSAIEGGRVRDPALRAQIMALRFDPGASSAMAAELAGDNAAALAPLLGRDPDAAELYLAHFLGIAGASQFLSALASDPGQSAAALLPKAAAANRAIFFEGAAPRSVGAVMELLRGKVERAMGDSSPGSSFGQGAGGWGLSTPAIAGVVSIPQPFPGGEGPGSPRRPSMADTLRDAFGLASADGQAQAPAFVRAAYGNLRSLGL